MLCSAVLCVSLSDISSPGPWVGGACGPVPAVLAEWVGGTLEPVVVLSGDTLLAPWAWWEGRGLEVGVAWEVGVEVGGAADAVLFLSCSCITKY